VTLLTGITDVDKLVIDVTNLTDSSLTVDWEKSHLA
jgi:hypothetical protein